MPRYYCDYCDTYLTHDSPSVRKQHNAGYKHKANVRSYYQQFEELQTQILIDQKIKEHLGQSAVYQQVGAAYNQHLASLPGNIQRPRLPVLPPPVLPIPGAAPSLLIPGIRPPVLPRPGFPGYGVAPPMAPVAGQPPVGSSMPMQMNGLPGHPMLNPPATVPGGVQVPGSSSAPPTGPQAVYQANPAGTTAPSNSIATDRYSYAQASEGSR
ncbi:U1 small nuclear ribonucleoprotein C-like [Diospyros lotus]|uniref:U1 small nuclear ribonucleoprotein C-like n=1 Tax=Diospyros lotus TaxID=55363 RepID=UPI00225A6A3E|nr:U1 small nuclear ribonucleoprotein C-like [Diospyros lotus]